MGSCVIKGFFRINDFLSQMNADSVEGFIRAAQILQSQKNYFPGADQRSMYFLKVPELFISSFANCSGVRLPRRVLRSSGNPPDFHWT